MYFINHLLKYTYVIIVQNIQKTRITEFCCCFRHSTCFGTRLFFFFFFLSLFIETLLFSSFLLAASFLIFLSPLLFFTKLYLGGYSSRYGMDKILFPRPNLFYWRLFWWQRGCSPLLFLLHSIRRIYQFFLHFLY